MKMMSFPINSKYLSDYEDIDRNVLVIIEEKIEDGYMYNVEARNDFDTDFDNYLLFEASVFKSNKRISEDEFLELIDEFYDYHKKQVDTEDYYNRIS